MKKYMYLTLFFIVAFLFGFYTDSGSNNKEGIIILPDFKTIVVMTFGEDAPGMNAANLSI